MLQHDLDLSISSVCQVVLPLTVPVVTIRRTSNPCNFIAEVVRNAFITLSTTQQLKTIVVDENASSPTLRFVCGNRCLYSLNCWLDDIPEALFVDW